MTNYQFKRNVEISCKTPCKTQCNSTAKLCVKLLFTFTTCEYPLVFHYLLTFIPYSFTQITTSISKQSFPLFHQAYYNNY